VLCKVNAGSLSVSRPIDSQVKLPLPRSDLHGDQKYVTELGAIDRDCIDLVG